MSAGSIGNVGMSSPISQKGLSDTTSIDQKIRQLEEQLKRVKADKKLSAEEREKRMENIKKQIERLKQQKEQKVRAAKDEQKQPSQRGGSAPVDEGHLIDVMA